MSALETPEATPTTIRRYATTPPGGAPAAPVGWGSRLPATERRRHRRLGQRSSRQRDARRLSRLLPAVLGAALLVAFVAWCTWEALGADDAEPTALTPAGAMTLAVFAVAIWLWVFSSVGDTYVAIGAAVVLVVIGMLPADTLFQSLGEDTVWLLLSAFVISAGVTSTGLATRVAVYIVTGATGLRQLAHLITSFLVVTAFAVPATSGRAALTLPVFVALAKSLEDRRRVVLALSLLFPSVILLSAVGSYLGAGAHLITSQILQASGYEGFSFATWLVYGLPLSLVSSHLCAEIIVRMFTTGEDRRAPMRITAEEVQAHSQVPVTGPLTVAQNRAALLVSAVVVLWCTEPVHGLHPAIVALLGALLVASPNVGSVSMGKAIKAVPWSLLLFMSTTLALGAALVSTGAAQWLAHRVLGPVAGMGAAAGAVFVVLVVAVSAAAHLVIQSRSARSAVLIPLVVSLAPGVGVDPVAAALASTAAAGFCHTLTSSAKPVTLFSDVEDVETYTPRHLLRLSVVLGPVLVVLVLLFAFLVWPVMGLPLFA
ncbi:SLC13 family permease [Actinomyces howellii]|uniref:Transporter, divalent anion:Na+ symporter (DASS) family n=1 Tax=Actinomyces howellii TaxID=52771 RepID=A0A3S4TBB9_9ACTO|nr:SLC13 family permease [Actinomyces howellii]VEG29982.1 transporter, divalent anion:Na+ symporter (DASS) family [Actinomyces howellii]